MRNSGWMGAVWKKTVWAFIAVLVVAVGVGLIAHHICPAAITMQQALHCKRV